MNWLLICKKYFSFIFLSRAEQKHQTILKLIQLKKNNCSSSILCMKMIMVNLIICKLYNAERAILAHPLIHCILINEFFRRFDTMNQG